MRKLIILCGIFVVFIGGSFWTQSALGKSSQSLTNCLNRVISQVTAKQWSEANTAFDTFDRKWSQVETWWALITDHEEIDEISRSLHKVTAYLDSQDHSGALAELTALTYLISHIPDKERLTLSTLF